jgi:phosphatidylglycerophosphate synthase
MIDGPFRSIAPRYSGWLISIYRRCHLTPNHVTLLGFGFGILASAMVALGNFQLALAFWWIGRVFDGTDGVYARAIGRVSAFGGYLDIVLDMAAYGAMIIGFAVQFPEHWLLWILIEFFYILCITTALALGAMERSMKLNDNDNRSLRLASGLAEGGETGIAYSLFLLFPQNIAVLAMAWTGILLFTVVSRSLLAWKIMR